jgi:hypothetical protein
MSGRAAILPVVLLVVAVAIRLLGVTNPPVDIHHVRQSDTASIARNMAREGIDLLHPRVDWAGPDAGTVESEVPVYNALVSLGWASSGTPTAAGWAWARLLSVLAWLGGGLALLLWVRRRLEGPPWAFLVLYALSPLAVAFSRNMQPDALAVCLLLFALERTDAASDREGSEAWLGLVLAGLLAALAIAIKGTVLPFVLLAPVILLARRRGAAGPAVAVVLALSLIPPAVWYWHAHAHLGVDGASFGLWGGDSHKWGGLAAWLQVGSWRSILGTFIVHAATPVGLAAAALGASRARDLPELRPFALALVAAAVSVILVTEGFALHNYYQLAFVPFLSVLAGAGAVEAIWWLRGDDRNRRAIVAVAAAVLAAWTLLAGQSFVREAVRREVRIETTGIALQALVPPGRSLLVVDQHPQSVLFAADRRGFHRTQTHMAEALALREAGAQYLYISATSPSYGDGGLQLQLREHWRLEARSLDWVLFAPKPGWQPATPETPSGDDDDSAGEHEPAGDDDSAGAPVPSRSG